MATVDKAKLQAIRRDLDALLVEVGARHGVTITTGHGVYGKAGGADGTLALLIEGTTPEGLSGIEQEFLRYCAVFGFSPEDLGRTFTTVQGRFTIVGVDTGRSKKQPIVCKGSDGRLFKFGPDLKILLNKQAPDA